jgi:hypothetical protein
MNNCDDWNYMNDPRNCDGFEKPILYTYHDDGEATEVELPTHYEVCGLCRGEGKHVNPAIDAGGLSGDRMDDPEFMEGYMSGVYDIACNSCKGKRVVQALDENACTPEQLEAYNDQCEEEHYHAMESAAERRMGA